MKAHTKEDELKVISRVLEETAFIFSDLMESYDMPKIDKRDAKGVTLTFKGDPSGELHLWAGNDFVRVTAANMLGIDEQAPDAVEKGIDALKELLNIIVGNYLTEIYGTDQIYDLGIPDVLSVDSLSDDFKNSEAIWLTAEDCPILVVVKTNDKSSDR